MKKIYLLLIILPFIYSCEENDPSSSSNDKSSNKYINEWIYKEMSTYYLWNTNLPQKSKLDFNSSPKDIFYSILYKRGQNDGDRFSWIEKDGVIQRASANTYDIGFEYTGYLEKQGSTNVIGQVVYVKPNTDAQKKGIKRGDCFTKVNGVRLSTSNFGDNFNSGSASITFINSSLSEIGTKDIICSVNYAENPVFLDTVYNEGTNRIGYLVYNSFKADEDDNSRVYDLDLNNAFGKFKAAGITHLVLDLRYNNGGLMSSATLLGSMIVPNLNTSNVFTKIDYNSNLNQNSSNKRTENFTNTIEVSSSKKYPLNNAGNNLQALYILTSEQTASASELVINNIKPYMPNKVYLIGDVTVGKNVGSVSFEEKDNPDNKWKLQPIILRYFNCNGQSDFLDGFKPDVEEFDNSITKKNLGNKDEVMLAIALKMIQNNGVYRASSTGQNIEEQLTSIGSSIEKRSLANKTIVDIKWLSLNE